MQVWLNGQFVDRNDARISAFDAGLQHGVGLFETMLARQGRVFRPAHHIERLIHSAKELRLSERLRADPLIEAVEMAVQEYEHDDARVRLTITGGDLNLLQSAGQTTMDPTILIVCQPPTPYPAEIFQDGVTTVIADDRLSPFDQHAGHKTLNYWPRIRALQIAATSEAGEALWFTVSNHLAGGSVSNVFLVKDNELLTPPARGEEVGGSLPSPVLPGITRRAVLEIAEADGIPVKRQLLDIEQLLDADEAFLTNSSWGVLPVVKLERESIGEGVVGPVTARMRESWLELTADETSQGF